MTVPHARIRSALRKIWCWQPEWRAAKKAAKVQGPAGLYLCRLCQTVTREAEVDHVEPVGPTPGSRNGQGLSWDGFISRLFEGELQVLCRSCHRGKTRGAI